MLATRIGKRFTFEASHRLHLHDGKCARPHGHSYVVDVTLVGEPVKTGPKTGMVYDFGDLARAWKVELEPLLDHHDLNEIKTLPVTTAEVIAQWIHRALDDSLPRDVEVERVRVWETRTSWAEWPA